LGFSSGRSLPAEAIEYEKRYEWDSAARCYRTSLETSSAGPSESAELALRLGRCLELAANQAGEEGAIRGYLSSAVATYQEIERRGSDEAAALVSSVARARRLRLQSMLAQEISVRRALLDEALGVQRSVVEHPSSGPISERLGMGNFHLLLLRDRFCLDSGESGGALVQEAIDLSQRLISSQTSALEADELAEAFAFRLYFAALASAMLKEWSKAYDREALIVDSALALVPKIRDLRVLAFLHIQIADSITQGLAKSQQELEEQIELAVRASRATRDRSLLGLALLYAVNLTRWQLRVDRGADEAKAHFRKIQELFEEGKRSLDQLLDSPSQHMLPTIYADFAQSHHVYATCFVTDLDARRRLLEEDLALFREGSTFARRTAGFPVAHLGFVGVEALRQLAPLEGDRRRQQEILAEAVGIAETNVEITTKVLPLDLWSIGLQNLVEASVRSDLALRIEDPVKKKETLLLAADRFRSGLSMVRDHPTWSFPGQYLRIAEFNLRFAKVLGELHGHTGDQEFVTEQLRVLDGAEEAYARGDAPARAAEVLWQKAVIRSRTGLHTDSSGEYGRSAELYQSAASKNPSLEGLYGDLSLYMRAWSKIETARGWHSDEAYRRASEAYQQAGSMLRSTQRWSPHGEHYAACAMLEEAETLSHEEDPERSSQSFTRAAELFESFGRAIAVWVPPISGDDESEGGSRWEAIASGRRTYCLARADLEDAKLLDRKGDHAASAQRFAAAAAALEGMMREEETDESRREMGTLALVCRAWQSMKEAEMTGSAGKYGEAAGLFDRAAANRKFVAPLRGNSALCRALETGTRLRLTRDPTLYPQTKAFLESALDSYIEAGMSRAAMWTRATERMFDGLVYQADAEKERDAPAKLRDYSLSARNFRAAVRLFEEAGYAEKMAQAARYLLYAREQTEVLAEASPADALDGSIVLRGAEVQISPGLTADQPSGVQGFEGANLQVQLVADRSEITLGESAALSIELVSAGRLPALLVKVSGLRLEGLEVETVGEKYRIDDTGAVAMKGLRMEPFETFTLNLRLRPTAPGDFTLRPRAFFLDENDRYRTTQPRPVSLSVRPREETPGTPTPAAAGGLSVQAQAVFDCLVRAFVEDYMNKRLQLEQAGWKSLSEIAQATKISPSALYGRQGRYGKPLADLIHRGLIETRILTGQRGRGGETVKVRIAYDRDPVKRYVDRSLIGSR
jgi:tetratricopeptide (TPR) repeat protein